jgi:anti-anti-sigma factor
MDLSLTRRERAGRGVTLTPAGEVDLRCAGALRAAIQDALRMPHPVDVVVDLGRVTFLDCAGIGALVAGRNTAVGRGHGYRVVNLQPFVRHVLDLTGVLTALTSSAAPARPTGQPGRSSQAKGNRRDRRVAVRRRAQPVAPPPADTTGSWCVAISPSANSSRPGPLPDGSWRA